ncbi:hypothetical protein LCGC14_1643790 [marine sediment metagenome]|uniref:HTH merR-type domain-containing protein n=1 Tax=marine sediment metagenome TaxID=412755 RepID=A0A0F9KYQ7_9ZZZZ
MRIHEIAKELGVSRRTVEYYIERGWLPKPCYLDTVVPMRRRVAGRITTVQMNHKVRDIPQTAVNQLKEKLNAE